MAEEEEVQIQVETLTINDNVDGTEGTESDDVLADLVTDGQQQQQQHLQSPTKKFSGEMSTTTLMDWGSIEQDISNEQLLTQVIDDNRFIGKTIVITGAGGQLGREGCRYFAQRGARIAALDRSKDGLKGTFDELQKDRLTYETLNHNNNNQITFDFKPYVCDVTNSDQIKEVIDSIVHRCDKIDYVWNNAGYQGKIKPLLDADIADFKMTMDINVNGMFIVLQAVARKMVELQTLGCSIVNTSSVAAQRGTPYMQAYSASKAAVLSLSINAAKELAQYGIRVNSISPALIGPGFLWDRQNKLHAKAGAPFFDSNPDVVADNKIKQVPLHRLGTPEEVVNVVSFLFSSDASYVTGQNINIDGGLGSVLRA